MIWVITIVDPLIQYTTRKSDAILWCGSGVEYVGTSRTAGGVEFMSQAQSMSLSALDQYRREVNWIPRLTDEEEARLLRCIACGKMECSKACPDDRNCEEAQRARTRLVEGYQSLVMRLARRYKSHCREMEFLDLVQE